MVLGEFRGPSDRIDEEDPRWDEVPVSYRVNEDGTVEYPDDWTEEQIARSEASRLAWEEFNRTGDMTALLEL